MTKSMYQAETIEKYFCFYTTEIVFNSNHLKFTSIIQTSPRHLEFHHKRSIEKLASFKSTLACENDVQEILYLHTFSQFWR